MLNKEDLNHLYQYACSLTQNDEQAYDLVHEAVIKLQKYNPENSIAYAKSIIKNLYFDQYKKNKRESSNQFDQIDEIGSTEDLEALVITRNSVNQILNNISPDERELLFEWAVEGKTVQEIADERETKLGTLLSKISRLRKKIMKMESEK